MLMPSLNSCANPFIVFFFNKNLLKTLKESCRCGNWCHKTEYIHQIEEYTSNCDTRYSSQTEIDLINTNILLHKKRNDSNQRSRSSNNNLPVPNGLLNNNKKLGQKSYKNGNMNTNFEYSSRNMDSSISSSDTQIRFDSRKVISPAIEMKTLYTQSYGNGIPY